MIADRIHQARLAAGLTLGALGEKIGVSHTAIQKYEKGLLTPSSAQLPLPAFAPPANLPEHVVSLDEIDAFSDTVRNAWQLGLNPIADLTDTLEGLGLLVIVVDEENPGFSGLTAKARTEDGREYPVVAVSKRWPGDRQRFTLAHELGHLLLEGRLADGIDEEKARQQKNTKSDGSIHR